jgi:hypothetical protein
LLVRPDGGTGAHGAADRVHVLGCEATCRGPEATIAWLKVMRALVLKHRAGPTYVTNESDPAGPDVPGGWHCRECGLDRDGPTDDWPCEVIVMVATLLWHANRPGLPVAWAWTAPEDQLIWRRGGAGGQTTRAECEAVEPRSRPTTARPRTVTRFGRNIAAAPDQAEALVGAAAVDPDIGQPTGLCSPG